MLLSEFSLSPGVYESEDHLCNILNDNIKKTGLQKYYEFSFSDITKKITLTFPSEDNRWYKVCLSKALAIKTGFYQEHNVSECFDIIGRGGSDRISEFTTRIDEIDQLFVSCDLAANFHQVGSVRVPVLAIVPASNENFGSNVIFEPNTLIWLPLKRKTFNSAQTYISDKTGNHIPFTSGTSVVRVQIRRKSFLP